MPATTPTQKPKGKSGKTIRTSSQQRLLPTFANKKKLKKPANANKKKKGKSIFSFKNKIVRFSIIVGLWGGIAVSLLVLYYALTLPDISKLGVVQKKPSITIVDEKNNVLSANGDLYGEYITFNEMPPHLVQAVIATEDRRFFHHFGVDVFGLARAVYTNFRADRVVQGGSTITQQLAKIVFLTPDRTIERKIKEMILAFWLEHKFTKQEILTIYLNRVYLGSGNYGIAAASRYYFGKDVRDINISEAAILAGLLKAPTRYSPAIYPDRSKERARQVLINMVSAGYLTMPQVLQEQQYRPAALENGVKESLKHPYFADWVMEQLPDYIGAVTSDIRVKTTLDIRLQDLAEKSIQDVMNTEGVKLNAKQAALISITPDGKIVAMVGGRNYNQSQFNRAVKAERQPGSAFKLFVYLTALEHGYQPGSTVIDSPIRIKNWSPTNYDNRYHGSMTLTEALADSVNTIAVKLSEEAGRDNVIAMAKRLGINSPMESLPSIALGSTEVNLLELTRAYAHLANNGMRVVPYGILEIRDASGDIIYQRKPQRQERVLSEQVVADMNTMLSAVMQSGTARGAQIGRPAAGKTGTSQDFRDAWLMGYTPDLATGVWVGNDDNKPMNSVTGGKLPAHIWRQYMSAALAGKPVRSLPSSYGWGRRSPRGNDDDAIWDSIIKLFGGGSNKSTAPAVEYDYPTSH